MMRAIDRRAIGAPTPTPTPTRARARGRATRRRATTTPRATTPRATTPRATTRAEKTLEKARAIAITAMTTLTMAGAARADAQEVQDYLLAFWKFRTADTTSFLLYTVAPIMVPYAVFAVLIKRKTETQLAKLEEGGWIAFMAERELDATTLELPQLNAFCKAADAGVLDDAMVTEFVRKLKLSEQWKKSTIAIDDTRAEEAKKRARAEAILEAKRARGDFDKAKEESSV
jgi:hypothetical protein